jgi:protein-S-isoprenylcysteine O-methyltransferase Ste14
MDVLELWEEFSMVTALIIFTVYIVLDGLYAYYTIAVTNKDSFKAATTGSVMHVLLAVGVLSYVQNFLYIIPLAVGSWIGTYFVVKYME